MGASEIEAWTVDPRSIPAPSRLERSDKSLQLRDLRAVLDSLKSPLPPSQLLNKTPQKALHWAVQYEKYDEIRLLLNHGIDDARPDSLRRCMSFAVRREDCELLMQLLAVAKDKDLLAAILGDLDFLKLFAKSGTVAVLTFYLEGLGAESREEIVLSVGGNNITNKKAEPSKANHQQEILDTIRRKMREGGQPWPDRVERDVKTKEWVKITPMEPGYWN
ncbi:MAG: hypothetical protein Q9201_000323 [Fulgogasparrea decipioides]